MRYGSRSVHRHILIWEPDALKVWRNVFFSPGAATCLFLDFKTLIENYHFLFPLTQFCKELLSLMLTIMCMCAWPWPLGSWRIKIPALFCVVFWLTLWVSVWICNLIHALSYIVIFNWRTNLTDCVVDFTMWNIFEHKVISCCALVIHWDASVALFVLDVNDY